MAEEKMKKELLIAGAILILLTVGLSGCMEEKSKFIDSWQVAEAEQLPSTVIIPLSLLISGCLDL